MLFAHCSLTGKLVLSRVKIKFKHLALPYVSVGQQLPSSGWEL